MIKIEILNQINSNDGSRSEIHFKAVHWYGKHTLGSTTLLNDIQPLYAAGVQNKILFSGDMLNKSRKQMCNNFPVRYRTYEEYLEKKNENKFISIILFWQKKNSLHWDQVQFSYERITIFRISLTISSFKFSSLKDTGTVNILWSLVYRLRKKLKGPQWEKNNSY
jgi:hypothetical protein